MPPRRNPKVDPALAIKAESSREGAAAFASPTASTPHTRRSSRTVDHDSISPLTPPSSIEDDEADVAGKLGQGSARKVSTRSLLRVTICHPTAAQTFRYSVFLFAAHG